MTVGKEPVYVHCGKCSHEWPIAFLPLPIDAFARLAKAACPMCGEAKQVFIGPLSRPTAEGNARAWLTNGDTGISSETIWSVLTGHPVRRAGVPRDPQDFGRCHRLLKVMPAWRARLPEVAAKYPEWKPLVDAWDELTALYEEELPKGRPAKLYDRMKELRASLQETG